MELRPRSHGTARLGAPGAPDPARPATERRRRGGGASVTLHELHEAFEVAGAVASGGPGNALAKPKPCLLTQKWLTPRWRHMGELKSASVPSKWHLIADAIHQQAAKQKLHPAVIEGALNFLRALVSDPKFLRQRSLLLRLLQLVEKAVYIDSNASEYPSASRIPYFVGHHWLSARLQHLKKSSISMSEVIRRCERFENIRVQVQGRLMELDQRRTQALRLKAAVPLAQSMNQEEEEEEEVREKEDLDVAADRFAKKLASGRSGRSSLIWLWGVWKLVHAQLLRKRRKKGELLTRTLIGDLVAPFRHWMIFAVENRCDSKLITYHTYLQERQMYTRTAMDLQNKREDLVLDLQVSNNSCRRLTRQLESKRQEREQLHERLQNLKPAVLRSLLSRVLDLTLLETLQTGKLERLRLRLTFLTRDLAPLLLSDEDSPWRLFGFRGDQVLTRWSNHELAQFKLVANEVLEAMSKRNSEDNAEDLDIEWSARETEIYGDRCRLVRNMKQLTHLEDDHEGVLLAVLYGAVCATGSLPHPVSLWPLDEKEAEAKAIAMCKAIRQVIPTRAQYLLQPSDVINNKGGLIPALLAVIFMLNSTLPCSSKHEVLHSASFAIQSAVAQEAYKEPRKKGKGHAQELSFTPMDLPAPVDAQQRKQELQKRIQTWLIDPDTLNFDAPTMADPVVKSIFQQIEAMAGPWAVEPPQDYSLLLKEDEAASTLLQLPAHDLLLRWVNFHLAAFRGDPDAGLLNLNELDLSLLVELLTKLAPDVMNLHEEEQTALRMAHNPTAADAASVSLVTKVATRCTGYEILTEEVLSDEQTDMMASFLSELMACRAQLPVRRSSELGQHMETLASIVLEAANTQNNQLVSGLCGYLRDHQQSLTRSLEVMRLHHEMCEAVQGKLRSFALKVLVKRSQGVPCDLLELASQPSGQRGDLVGGNNVQAVIAREMARIPSQDGPETDLAITFAQTAVEELLKKHIGTFRDVFRMYARETSPHESDARVRTSTITSTMTLEAAHVLVVSPRHLMKLYRDCRLQDLRLDPVEVEEVYNEVKMQHAINNFEDVQRFETGLSLEMFVEALLTMACRTQLEDVAPTAFHEKLDHMLEHYLVPFAGSQRDDVVYQLLVDESLDELIDEFSPRLRSVFAAYASGGDRHAHAAASPERTSRQRGARGAVIKETALNRKQVTTMSLDAFTELLQHCQLLSETIHRACVGRIFLNLLELRSVPSEAVDEDGASPSISEDADHVASLMEDDHVGASFQYSLCFQEFLDGLIILTLFKEPNPFVSFNIRLDKFLRTCILDPLFEFANGSNEPRFRALYQALDDAAQKDVSASGIAKKLKMAEM